ncbi:hypothetical protein WDU94_007628 [Cyamophila willieti]
MRAINTIAVPLMTYSFGIIDWLREDIKNIDRKTRKLLTSGKMHHPKDDVDRLYIKRQDGGRGLLELESMYEMAILGLHAYIQEEKDKLVKIIKEQEVTRRKFGISKEAAKIMEKYQVEDTRNKEVKNKIKKRIEELRMERLKGKPMHGQFMRHLDKNFVNKRSSVDWLNSAGLKGETESLLLAAQNQALNTRYRQRKINKQNVDSRCRLCNNAEEHISHIISGCTILAPTEYTIRHNRVASYIHWTICKSYGLNVNEKYYQHTPDPVINITTEEHNVTIMWDVPIITDRQINANRPDIIVHDKKNKMCQLIDIAVPDDPNIQMKEAEKINKYKNLAIEISRMWNTRTTTIPVIVGALGTIKYGLEQHLQRIPGKSSIRQVQKITLLSTAHILRKVLS